MRNMLLAVALFGLTVTSALAQSTTPAAPFDGARPGHTPGTGDSLPLSTSESNIASAKSRSSIAPTLPASPLGDSAASMDYMKAARAALVAGQTGLAQQSLEMAETRALDSSVVPSEAGTPSQNPLVTHIHDALQALGVGDRARTIHLIDIALAS